MTDLFTGEVSRRVHRVGRALPRRAHGLRQRGVRLRRGRLLRRRLHLLGAEGGLARRGGGGRNTGRFTDCDEWFILWSRG